MALQNCAAYWETGSLEARLKKIPSGLAHEKDAQMIRKVGILMVLGLAACGSLGKKAAAPAAQGAPGAQSFSGPITRFIGRVDATNPNSVIMSWPGTAVETRFTGTVITATVMAGPTQTGIAPPAQTLVDLIVDGQAPVTVAVMATPTQVTTTVASGTHTARLVKRTEALFGNMTFMGFTTDGKLLNTATPPTRLIEFVGDSITAGLGVEGSGNPNCKSLDPNVENASKSFAYVTAATLNADFSLIGWSGKGVYKNRSASDTVTLPQLYSAIDPTVTSTAYAFPTTVAAQPQVVVVNLGTNDFAFFANQPTPTVPDQAGYTAALQGLTATIRGHYPSAKIILAIGPILSTDSPVTGQLNTWRSYVQSVVAALNNAGDTKVSFFEFTPLTSNFGCDYHPNAVAAQSMAAALSAQIKTLMAW
jgi:lysophospholipase L1-like esterase